MRGGIAAVVALAIGLGLGACKAFDESLLEEETEAACPLNQPPERPDADDGDDGEEYFYAIRELIIDQREDRWRTIGYDLDNLCSIDPNPEVECRAPSSAVPPETDGEGGIDNALGKQLVPIIVLALPGLEEELQEIQTLGTGVTLVKITGWNGEADDSRVEAVMSQSIFGTSREPDRVDSWSISGLQLHINGELWPPPSWDGNDVWWAREDNYLDADPGRPHIRDDNAYIADNTLVMKLPDRFPITYGGDTRAASFFLTDVTATVTLSEDRSSVENAVIAGRFAVLDFLSSLGPAGICPGSDDYLSAERLLELAADIRAIPETGGPGAVCDAISVGLFFETGTRARFGGIAEGLGIPNRCGLMPDGGVDGGPDGAVDSGTPDTGAPDTGAPDTGAPDTGAPDTGASDVGPADAGLDTAP